MFGSHNIRMRFNSRLKGLSKDAAWRLGFYRSRLQQAKGARILVYHGVCKQDPFRFNTLFITAKTFEAQLRLYKKYFNLISLNDFYEKRFSDDRFNVCLTFDDGFANNHKYVWPLLEQYQVPATFFVTGIREAGYDILWNDVLCCAYKYGPAQFVFAKEAFIKGRDRRYISSAIGQRLVDILRLKGFKEKATIVELFNYCKRDTDADYWLQMTEEEIKEVSASKWITIGAHGFYHNDLAKIPVDSAKEEIIRVKSFLENLLNKEVRSLAFPYGSYSNEVVQEAKNAGYTQLLATEFLLPGNTNDDIIQQRLTINPFISNINQLHANIIGNYK